MSVIKELMDNIAKAYVVTSNYDKMEHLFSDDEGVKSLNDLNRSIGKLMTLIKMSDIKEIEFPKNNVIEKRDSDYYKNISLVKIRPCADEYKDKTFAGFYLGDVATSSSLNITDDNKLQLNFASHNPAIFVPELNKIIYGFESWWGEIESIEELKEITDSDIENVWYVKALKERLNERKED